MDPKCPDCSSILKIKNAKLLYKKRLDESRYRYKWEAVCPSCKKMHNIIHDGE